jgi:diaminohydroxyphosphoribosylaminopyrimidine deaminase/5-amino-6-(5-phosphoribosylamino)uracil reductase
MISDRERQRDEIFMARALALARQGGKAVRPNPRVGAVLVKNGRMIASGYHARFGGPHAEVVALNKAGTLAKGSTLYVTLEPCSTYGKTPPCTDRILSRGLRRVVIGCRDENPAHRGRGAKILRSAGIDVREGVLEGECSELNRDFFVWTAQKRPYAVLKLALTLDGKIADSAGRSRWISSEESRRLVHRLRSFSDAVLVGVNTVIRDDPRLTVRMGSSHPGLRRVILDSSGRIPLSSRILHGHDATRTIVVSTVRLSPAKRRRIESRGAACLIVPERRGRVDIRKLFRRLAEMGIMRILIEGGGEVAASILEAGLVDEVHFFYSPRILGGRTAVPSVGGKGFGSLSSAVKIEDIAIRRIGGDICVRGRVARIR